MANESGRADAIDRTSESCYLGAVVALLTQHGKEEIVAPLLEEALGCRVTRVTGYDTDLLGTFTREIPRPGSQLDAARTKARIGMELSGLSIGLASEGAFGPDPFTGMFAWNREMLVWIDDELGIEVTGTASGKTNYAHRLAASWEDAENFARAAGFPGHWLVVRPEHEEDPRIRKGLHDWGGLREAFDAASGETSSGRVFIETDMRAHANPMRRETIEAATRDLVHNLASRCPICDVPGFHMAERISGLPCEECGTPTRETRAEIHRCVKCGHQDTVGLAVPKAAPAGRCERCNP